MSTKIFYFTGTGNSLSVARSIAGGLEDVELISIPKIINENIDITVETVGFIFPVYAWGLPQIVVDFISRLCLSQVQYVFAIATCSGTQGGTLLQLKKILQEKDRDLNAGFAIREKSHSPLKQVVIEKFVIWLNRHSRPLPIEDRLQEILTIIRQRLHHEPETGSFLAGWLGTTILHKLVLNEFKKYEKNFFTNEKCKLCGMCEKICPKGNIKRDKDRITWNGNCELCFACLNWCPQKAICIKDEITPQNRSHHQEIKISDIIIK